MIARVKASSSSVPPAATAADGPAAVQSLQGQLREMKEELRQMAENILEIRTILYAAREDSDYEDDEEEDSASSSDEEEEWGVKSSGKKRRRVVESDSEEV